MAEQQKVAVLITGTSTGIGRACALLLDRSDYQVFAGVRTVEALESLQREASGSLMPVILDITDAEQIAKSVETVTKALGPDRGLCGLVNNAGIVVPGPLEFLPIDSLRRQLEVNVIGHLAVTQAFLSLILKGRGRIVNIGSTAALFAAPFLGAYSASKSAMKALTDSLRRELLPRGIFVSIVHPGYTETPIWDKGYDQGDQLMAELPAYAQDLYADAFYTGQKFLERGRHHAIPAQTVAKAVRHALSATRPKTRYLVGADARLLYIASKFLPDRLGDWVVGKVLAK